MKTSHRLIGAAETDRSRSPDRKMGRSQSKREPHLDEKEGDQSGRMDLRD